jgi:hypothetical protein
VFFFFFFFGGGGGGIFALWLEKKIHSNQKIIPNFIYFNIFYKGFFLENIYTKVARFISLELKKACGFCVQIYSKKLDFFEPMKTDTNLLSTFLF